MLNAFFKSFLKYIKFLCFIATVIVATHRLEPYFSFLYLISDFQRIKTLSFHFSMSSSLLIDWNLITKTCFLIILLIRDTRKGHSTTTIRVLKPYTHPSHFSRFGPPLSDFGPYQLMITPNV